MQIEILSPHNTEKYNDFIKNHIHGMLYYTVEYKNLIEDTLNCQSQYIIATNDNHIVGILPLMYKDGKYGRVYNSLPFYGSHGGAIGYHDTKKALYKYLQNEIIAKEKNLCSVNIVSNIFDQEFIPNFNYNYTDERIGQMTYLPENGEDLENKLMMYINDVKRRNNIRKAMKENVVVKVDNNAIDFLYTEHVNSMNAIGGKAKSQEFFYNLPKYLTPNKDYKIYVAYLDNKPIAAVLFLYSHRIIEYFTPVTIAEYRNLQPASLIIFQAMINGIKDGCKIFNWGGTWKTQDNVYQFKKQWTAKDIEYKYYTYLHNKDILKSNPSDFAEYNGFYVINYATLEKN